MTEIVSIKFKSSGKNYYFSPNGLKLEDGDTVIVETAKGLEIALCTHGNRSVEDSAVIQPLRPVVRKATEQDLRVAEQNRIREKDALVICQQKIEEHGLEMKLVDVECSFDGSKTLFFFTADGRVDFRELVKDLASVFHNRIELRQIGVRDEAKMLGGIGICGRPYCCSAFLNDFAPVSTKMAKIQNLSLNPAKISGSCGRLMCCLRYEEEAYEDLVKRVPKVGAFVETTEGYGTVSSIDLLHQKVKVHLENESDESTRVFRSVEIAVVPGGHPAEGEPYPHVLQYVPEEEEEEAELSEDPWAIPTLFAEEKQEEAAAEESASEEKTEAPRSSRRSRSGRRSGNASRTGREKPPAENPPQDTSSARDSQKQEHPHSTRRSSRPRHSGKAPASNKEKPAGGTPAEKQAKHSPDKSRAQAPAGKTEPAGAKSDAAPVKKRSNRHRYYGKSKKPSGTNSSSSN